MVVWPKIYLLIFFILCISTGYSQCTVSTGVPLINETFGAGPDFGAPLPAGVTNLQYLQDMCPNDGQYTIASYTSGCWGNGWHTLTDHTGNPNGYFMLINASYQPSDFYLRTISGLCSGTTYEFSSWIINMANNSGGILPDITFTIEKTDGTVLGTYDTGTIPVINPVTWAKYGFYFKTPDGVSTVVIRMHNNADGGAGNDLAIDDIGFTPTGPLTTITTKGAKNDSLYNYCIDKNITLTSTVGACYINTTYQWQQSTDDVTWTDITGANSSTYALSIPNTGTRYYRLAVAEVGNIENVNCRVNSNTLVIVTSTAKIKNFAANVCFGSAYTFPSGKTSNKSGTYMDTLRSVQGCDSVISKITLTVSPAPFITQNISICQGQSYLGYTKTGTYQDTIAEPGGCDSLHVINLTVKARSYSTVSTAICEGKTYLGYTKTGTYIDTLTAANGCDSIRTLNLIVNPVTRSNLTSAICQGQSYLSYTKTGTYIDTLQSAKGCDSIRTLNLLVKPTSTSSITAVACSGQSYLGYTKTGIYIDTLLSASGCDSVRTLNLTIYPIKTSAVTANICQGQDYAGHTISGTYIDTLSSSHGCDSIRTLNLTVSPLPKPSLGPNLSMCFGDTVTLSPGTFSTYLWQDKTILPYYKVTGPGTYWVKVYDENDCEGTDTVTVSMTNCKPIKIPNTFTPNNDGINDTWEIAELAIYKNCNVQIFNRYGQVIFTTKGAYVPWDGKVNGKEVPVGTYYYIINVADIREKFSGWLLLVR